MKALFVLAADWLESQWPSPRYDQGVDDALAKLTTDQGPGLIP